MKTQLLVSAVFYSCKNPWTKTFPTDHRPAATWLLRDLPIRRPPAPRKRCFSHGSREDLHLEDEAGQEDQAEQVGVNTCEKQQALALW